MYISAKHTPPRLWDNLPHRLGSHQRLEDRNPCCQKLRKKDETGALESDYVLALFNCAGSKGEQKGISEIWYWQQPIATNTAKLCRVLAVSPKEGTSPLCCLRHLGKVNKGTNG